MIDSHCHLADPQFSKDLESVLERARAKGIEKIINVAYDLETSQQVMKMSEDYNWLLPAVGIHPNEASTRTITEMDKIRALIENNRVYAVGETGLDYYRNFAPADEQKALFRRHIQLAQRFELPLIIHNRNAFNDAIAILKDEKFTRGVFHCFTGDYASARKVLDLGFFISFAGNLTYNRAIQEVLKKVGAGRLLLETDAPYLAPKRHRGRRNEPSFIVDTLQKAAELLQISEGKLSQIIFDNGRRLFSY